MLKKALAAAVLAGLSGAALAHPPHWAPAHGYRGHHYYPPVRYYQPPLRYFYAPAPIIVPPPGIVIRLRFPL